MNWFKRLCLFVFGVAGLLSLAALSLVWVGPWTGTARTFLLENELYFLILEVLVCVSAVGLLLCVLVPLFYPRNVKETVVSKLAGGNITVTRAAVVSQVKHIVEADGSCKASSVRVRMRKKGNVRVRLRVAPHVPVDVVQRGAQLHNELMEGLSKVCGSGIRSVDIVFAQAEQQGPIVGDDDLSEAPQQDAAPTQAISQDITLSMDKRPAVAEEQAAGPVAEPVAEQVFEPVVEHEYIPEPEIVYEPEAEAPELVGEEISDEQTAEAKE